MRPTEFHTDQLIALADEEINEASEYLPMNTIGDRSFLLNVASSP
ncbi:hypothetical protein BMY_1017 [Wohlfahrtiimonas chitiniclastica]|nr:hypothetical protein BMY_1017 [Wohlfahrtiimonas chitiniclastica]